MFVLFLTWCLHFIVAVASPADAQTLSSSYQASFHFRTLSCFLTPQFEVGCTGGDGSSLVVEDGVTLGGDTAGSITCILHPTKGDLFRLCTASVLAGIDGQEQSAQFAIRFRCEGSSPDLLSSVVEIVTTTAQCAPVVPAGNTTSMPSIYYSASLAAYDDWSGEEEEDASQLDYSQVCQQGVPEELSSDEEDGAFGCVQYVSGCNGTSSLSSQSSGSNGCTLPLQSTRSSFDGASLPDGAIRTAEQDIRDDEKQRRPGLAVFLGVIVMVVAAAALLFAIVTHFVRNSNNNNNTREMQPRQQPPPPKHTSADSAKTMRTELSSATLDVPDKKPAAVMDKTTTCARFVPSRGAEVDPDQIQKYGFRVIRQHLNGPESNELSLARLPL